jgi:hypothetical protein
MSLYFLRSEDWKSHVGTEVRAGDIITVGMRRERFWVDRPGTNNALFMLARKKGPDEDDCFARVFSLATANSPDLIVKIGQQYGPQAVRLDHLRWDSIVDNVGFRRNILGRRKFLASLR